MRKSNPRVSLCSPGIKVLIGETHVIVPEQDFSALLASCFYIYNQWDKFRYLTGVLIMAERRWQQVTHILENF